MAEQKAKVTSSFRARVDRVSTGLTWTAIGGLATLVLMGGAGRDRGAEQARVLPSEPVSTTRRNAGADTLVGQDASSQASFEVADAKLKVKRTERRAERKSAAPVPESKAETAAPVPVAPAAPVAVAPAPAPAASGSSAPPVDKPGSHANAAATAATPPESVEPPFWSDAEIAAARAECAGVMAGVEADWSIAPPMKSTSCGSAAPIFLKSIGAARVELAPAATTNCQTAAALARWLDTHVQPAAKERFGAAVSRITLAGSYSCRNRYGQKAAPLSEHALANAVDISSFKLANGRTISVSDGWGPTARSIAAAETAAKAAAAAAASAKPDPKVDKAAATHTASAAEGRMKLGVAASTEKAQKATQKNVASVVASPAKADPPSADAQFLRAIHAGACRVFGTVLGPEANEAHRDHFHFDMKHRRRSAFCE